MRNWKTWAIAALILAVVGFAWFRWLAASQLEAAKQRVRDAGHPVTYAELDAYYERPPDAENRAYLLEYAMDAEVHVTSQAMENLPIAGNAELPHRSEPIPGEYVDAMREYMAKNTEAIYSTLESFELEACRFSTDLNLGPATPLEHLGRLRSLSRMLSIASLVNVLDGDTDRAAIHLAGIFELAESLEREPFLISQFVRNAIHGIGYSALEQALNRADFRGDELEKIQAKLLEVEANRAFVNGLIGERCTWNVAESGAFSLGDMSIGTTDLQDLFLTMVYRPIGLLDRDGAGYFALYEKLIATTELPAHEQLPRATEIEAETLNEGGFGMLTAILMPSVTGIFEADVRNRTQLRIAIVALAVARYHEEERALPESLDSLMPRYISAIPIDPYGGGPLQYRRFEDGFVTYSLGQNMQDDGGVESESFQDGWRKGDLTFTVKRSD